MRIDPSDHDIMAASLRPRRQSRPWLQLLNALLGLAGEHAVLLNHAETPWASITFSGTRHTAALQFSGEAGAEAAEQFIEALPEHEFAISRRIVADAAVIAVREVMVPERSMVVEAELLLLDD